MGYGFVRAACATPSLRVADCAYNADAIRTVLRSASADGIRLIVFPELSLTGYTCGDLFNQSTLLEGAKKELLSLAKFSEDLPLVAVVGVPLLYSQKLYNCAAVLYRGKILGIVPKTHLPNSGEFYELRHFFPAPSENAFLSLDGEEIPFGTSLLFTCRDIPSFSFAVELCEDLWAPESPAIRAAAAGATVLLNPSASDEVVGKASYRRMLVQSQSGKMICSYLYAGAGGGESTTDLVFSGHRIIAENGAVLEEGALFSEGITVSDLDVERLAAERRTSTSFSGIRPEGFHEIFFSMPEETEEHFTRLIDPHPFVPDEKGDRDARCSLILNIQSAGLQKRISHTGCKTAVIGISGGLDSTLALLVSVRAMDALGRSRKEILACTMPCFGTTKRTKSNAVSLCEALGVSVETIDITASVRAHFKDIGQSESSLDVTFENAQARERTQVLMDLANKTGGLVVGTGDLSELALGWATYNGDHMSMYGVNASVPKTLVRHLVRYVADTCGDTLLSATLLDILDTPVSPELLPPKENEISQKTEELVGSYELHDFFLYYFLRFGFSPQKILFLANKAFRGIYPAEEIQKWLKVFVRRFFSQQFKRSCLPDGPKIGSVALSPRGDWRMPSDACADLWLKSVDGVL